MCNRKLHVFSALDIQNYNFKALTATSRGDNQKKAKKMSFCWFSS